MSDKPQSTKAETSEVESPEDDVLDADLVEDDAEEGAPPEDPAALTPDSDAVADRYHAVMLMDDEGQNTGQLWTFDGKIMLFESVRAAERVLEMLKGADDHWVLRGVTAAHLKGLEGVASRAGIPLFVIVGFTPQGKVEAMPVETHERMAARAGTPPPLPPHKVPALGDPEKNDDET